MTRTSTMLIYSWATVFLSIGTLFLFMFAPTDVTEWDQDFIRTEMKPSVDFVQGFKAAHKRLPTNREFYTWYREYFSDLSIDLDQDADSLIPGETHESYVRDPKHIVLDDVQLFANADWRNGFAICRWRIDYYVYYMSWSGEYVYGSNSFSSMPVFAVAFYIIGLLPVAFWWSRR